MRKRVNLRRRKGQEQGGGGAARPQASAGAEHDVNQPPTGTTGLKSKKKLRKTVGK